MPEHGPRGRVHPVHVLEDEDRPALAKLGRKHSDHQPDGGGHARLAHQVLRHLVVLDLDGQNWREQRREHHERLVCEQRVVRRRTHAVAPFECVRGREEGQHRRERVAPALPHALGAAPFEGGHAIGGRCALLACHGRGCSLGRVKGVAGPSPADRRRPCDTCDTCDTLLSTGGRRRCGTRVLRKLLWAHRGANGTADQASEARLRLAERLHGCWLLPGWSAAVLGQRVQCLRPPRSWGGFDTRCHFDRGAARAGPRLGWEGYVERRPHDVLAAGATIVEAPVAIRLPLKLRRSRRVHEPAHLARARGLTHQHLPHCSLQRDAVVLAGDCDDHLRFPGHERALEPLVDLGLV